MREMSDIAIRVENLSKLYRIGQFVGYTTLRESMMNALSVPFRRFRSTAAAPVAESRSPGSDYIWALKDISFEIKQGEVVGIIGRNGAGKTTLLKVLTRITEPTEGHAEIYGRVGSLLEVGTGFHPELTGRENIYLNGAVLGMKRKEIDRKFSEIVEFAGVEKFIDTPLKRYSSGMQVRLAFSVAAHMEPEILLVDEVLAVGDTEFQKKSLGKMGDIARGGRTVLFISHNMSAIRSLCQRCILLDAGQLVLQGTTGECIDHYLSTISSDNPAEIETALLPRPIQPEGLGTALCITCVRLHSETGRAVIQCGEPLVVTMEFRCSEPLEDVTWGFAIESLDGMRILDCSSVEVFPPIQLLAPGKYSSLGSLQMNPLAPGHYRLVVGARCAKKGLDWLPEVMIFMVEDNRRYESLWLEAKSGIVRLPSQWTQPQRI